MLLVSFRNLRSSKWDEVRSLTTRVPFDALNVEIHNAFINRDKQRADIQNIFLLSEELEVEIDSGHHDKDLRNDLDDDLRSSEDILGYL